MPPVAAKKPDHIFEIKSNLEMHRVKKRKYPEVEEGDEVRVYTKKKNFQKERVPIWSENKYKVSKMCRMVRGCIFCKVGTKLL